VFDTVIDRAGTVVAMKGTARKRGPGKWQIQVYAGKDPRTGRDIRVTRSVAAPHTRAGSKIVDQALAAPDRGGRDRPHQPR
jgi:hypothetical protein